MKMKLTTHETIRTSKTYATPDLANLSQRDWMAHIRKEAEKVPRHTTALCEDHKQLLNGRR